jgi:PAS domain S-box-containing protein
MTVENISVLLVESDDILRAIYSRIIARQVKEVITATNGEDGFLVYKSHMPDIIITDIKLPVINGIDMVKKIRTLDKGVRVIIMSAFVDVKYFIQAIEAGVKGFLTKPIDSDKLTKILREQVHEILLERQIEEEGRRRKEAERDREKSDYILRILSETTALFLQQGISDENINDTLGLIGEATSASRLYIFRRHAHKKKSVVSQIYEWVEYGIERQLDNDLLKNIPISSPSFSRWVSILESDEIIKGNVETDFPEEEKQMLVAQDIKSILIIPVFLQNEWWGFIGLDECKQTRQWSEVEINALRLVANNIGAAFYRKRVEFELLSLNAQLENRVKERTKELEIEVAERKHTEVLLRESEEKYRLIFENANDGIILVNKSGEVLMVNPRMVEVFDMIPKKIIGKRFCDFIDEEFRKSTKSILSDKSSEEFYTTVDITITHKNGHVRWLELKPARINWDGEMATLVFVSDVTLRKIAEDELNKLNLHLENRIREEVQKVEQQQQLLIQKSKLESMGELAAGLAHEINQPLGGISMGLDTILYKLNENELTNDYLVSKISVLFKDIERIRNIINHVRVFSRDQQSIQKEKVEVSKIVKNTLSLVEKQFNSEHIQIKINLGSKPVFIYVNPYRVEQVLLNLLSNARYAVNKKSSGGAGSSYKKKVVINTDVKSNMVLISIEDNGIGMKDEIKNKIFEPFFTTKDLESGTGIGLSISYGIIKESNGRIFAQSAQDKGTKMFIELPII